MENAERARLRMRLITIRDMCADESPDVRRYGLKLADELIAEQQPVERPGARGKRKPPTLAPAPDPNAGGQP
jgi:hypothetical protein